MRLISFPVDLSNMTELCLGLVGGTKVAVDSVLQTSGCEVNHRRSSFPFTLLEWIKATSVFRFMWDLAIVMHTGRPKMGGMEGCGKDSIKFSALMDFMLKV